VGIFRRRRASERTTPDLVDLPVGFDRTAASMVVARCEAEGIPIRLLTMDDNGLTPGFAALIQHRVLIREQDRERVDAIIRQG
jgi:hypothetical protein